SIDAGRTCCCVDAGDRVRIENVEQVEHAADRLTLGDLKLLFNPNVCQFPGGIVVRAFGFHVDTAECALCQCGRPANQLSCSKILRAAVGFALPDSERTVNEELQWKFVTAVQLVAPVARVIPTELVGDWCKGTRIEEIVRIVGLPEYLCKVALRPIKP